MNIAIIPARGGSKRIPRKNIREFCGKPMLAWPIEVAESSGLFDQIVVSTDDEDIADVARSVGAGILERPDSLAGDHIPTQPVIAHAIEVFAAKGSTPTAVCCLYATAPFVMAEDLVVGRRHLDDPAVTYAFAATAYDFPIQRAFYLDDAGRPHMFQPEHALTRSQDLPQAYHDAGQFYWARPTTWVAGGAIFGPDACPVLLPPDRVQDIDTESDWRRAEALMGLILAK